MLGLSARAYPGAVRAARRFMRPKGYCGFYGGAQGSPLQLDERSANARELGQARLDLRELNDVTPRTSVRTQRRSTQQLMIIGRTQSSYSRSRACLLVAGLWRKDQCKGGCLRGALDRGTSAVQTYNRFHDGKP